MIGSRVTRHALVALLTLSTTVRAQEPHRDSIPLPEHPRPDLERAQWRNLNGRWDFAFDHERRRAGRLDARRAAVAATILVPFSWGPQLSGVPDSADIGWYARSITIPGAVARAAHLPRRGCVRLAHQRLDGRREGRRASGRVHALLGRAHRRTRVSGRAQRIVLRVDDSPHPFKLEGKQGYGKARGHVADSLPRSAGGDPLGGRALHPDLARSSVGVDARLAEPAPRDLTVRVAITNARRTPVVTQRIRARRDDVALRRARCPMRGSGRSRIPSCTR